MCNMTVRTGKSSTVYENNTKFMFIFTQVLYTNKNTVDFLKNF